MGIVPSYGPAGDSEPLDMIRTLDESLTLLDTSSVGGTVGMSHEPYWTTARP